MDAPAPLKLNLDGSCSFIFLLLWGSRTSADADDVVLLLLWVPVWVLLTVGDTYDIHPLPLSNRFVT